MCFQALWLDRNPMLPSFWCPSKNKWDQLPLCRDAVFPTFVGIPTFFRPSDFSPPPPLFFSFFPRACIVCVTTMRVNWWLSGQFWLRKSSSFKALALASDWEKALASRGLCPLEPPPGRCPWNPLGALPPDPRSPDTFLLFWTVPVASLFMSIWCTGETRYITRSFGPWNLFVISVQWNLVIKRSDITKPCYNKVILLVPALYISLFFTLI